MFKTKLSNKNNIFSECPNVIEYALLALMEIASHEDTPLSLREITIKQHIPPHYLEQILSCLKNGGLIQSYRGYKGGYVLSRDPRQITLLTVVNLMQEWQKKEFSEPSTPERQLVSEIWQQAETASKYILSRYTLQDLCQQKGEPEALILVH